MSTFNSCPETERRWKAEAAARGIGSIHGLMNVDSASSLKVDQFLALKAIWKIETNFNMLKEQKWAIRLGTTPEAISATRGKLREEIAWKGYLDSLAKSLKPNAPFPVEMGRFAMVLQNQRIVMRLAEAKHDHFKAAGSPMVTRSRAQLGVGVPPAPRWVPRDASVASEKSGPQQIRSSSDRSESRPRSTGESEASKHDSHGSRPDSHGSRPDSHGSRPDSHASRPDSHASRADSDATIISGFDFTLPKAERDAMADEQVVNTAAISFLQSLFVGDTSRNAYWSPQRKGFCFGNTKFKACVDGHLQVVGDSRSAAILEVKARRRPLGKLGDFRIEWQESAQMALWIREEPSSFWTTQQDRHKCRRILISQDHSEIYLTIAEYEDSYLHYLQNKKSLEDAGFLTMHRFGPFLTDTASNMDFLAGILKVLLPYAANYPPTEKSPSPSPPPVSGSASGDRGRKSQRSQGSDTGSRDESPLAQVTERLQGLNVNQGPSGLGPRSSARTSSQDVQQRAHAAQGQTTGHPSGTPTDQPAGPQVDQAGGQHGSQPTPHQSAQSDGSQGGGRGRGQVRGQGQGRGQGRGRGRGGGRGQ